MAPSQQSLEAVDSGTWLRQALHDKNIQLIDGTTPLVRDDKVLSQLVDNTAFNDAKGYVFMGEPDLQSTYLLYYLIDAAQCRLPCAFTNHNIKDEEGASKLKPIVICNYGPDGSKPADTFLKRVDQLHKSNLLKYPPGQLIHVVDHPDGILRALNNPKSLPVFEAPPLKPDLEFTDAPARNEEKPSVFLCCSFATGNEFYVELAKQLGQQLADNDYNLVTGGGRYPNGDPKHGMMYNAQKSAFEAGGDVTGVTFTELNPLADHPGKAVPHFGLSRIIKTRHLAERIEVMTDLSDAVVIAPGGLGTDTEAIGPILMKQVASAMMEGKPLIIVNTRDPLHPKEAAVHDALIALLRKLDLKEGEDFHVVENQKGISDPKEMAEATARAVIEKLSELQVHSHTRKLELSQRASRGIA